MIRKIVFIYGFFLLFPSKLYAVYWNDTDFLNLVGRGPRRIRNKFVTFDTTDTDIELAFQFNVPFVAVPTDRSMNNINNSIKSFINLNLGSVALASVMIIFGSLTSFLWSLIVPKFTNAPPNDTNTTTPPSDVDATNIDDNNNPTTDSNNPTNPIDDNSTTTTPTTNDDLRSDRANDDNTFMNLIHLIEETVEETMNPSVCIQQYLCALSKSASQNVAGGCGTSTDKILDGILSAHWILDIITGTAIHDAIRFGETTGDCYQKYYKCGFGMENLHDIFSMFEPN